MTKKKKKKTENLLQRHANIKNWNPTELTMYYEELKICSKELNSVLQKWELKELKTCRTVVRIEAVIRSLKSVVKKLKPARTAKPILKEKNWNNVTKPTRKKETKKFLYITLSFLHTTKTLSKEL